MCSKSVLQAEILSLVQGQAESLTYPVTAHRKDHLWKAAEPCPEVTQSVTSSTRWEQTAHIQKKNLFSRKTLTLKTQQKNRPDNVVNEGVNEGAMNLKITLCKRTSSFQMTCIISEAHILIYPAFSLTYTCRPSFIGGQMQSNYRWLKKIIIIKSSKKEIYIYIYIYIYTHCM